MSEVQQDAKPEVSPAEAQQIAYFKHQLKMTLFKHYNEFLEKIGSIPSDKSCLAEGLSHLRTGMLYLKEGIDFGDLKIEKVNVQEQKANDEVIADQPSGDAA